MLLAKGAGFLLGTLVPRALPFGEEALFRLHTAKIRREHDEIYES